MPSLKSKNNIVGITLGDPAGIGPEVVSKAVLSSFIKKLPSLKIIGHRQILRQYGFNEKYLSTVIEPGLRLTSPYPKGKIDKHCAELALSYLEKAVDLLKHGEIQALVTAPVNKEAIGLIQRNFQGHTEYLAHAFNVKNVGMMFVSKNLRTMIVTRHLPLSKVPQAISAQNILETIVLTHQALKKYFKIKNPHIAVCGLNPHAGEGGRMGSEEKEKIIPAIEGAHRKNINIKGPFAADTVFTAHLSRQFDAIVAMYHDQGLIPVKTLYFDKLLNLTVGLPFVRTSPSHGTAFDIAGKNKANPSSMIEAIRLAIQLSSQ